MASLDDIVGSGRHPSHDAAVQIVEALRCISKFNQFNRSELRAHAAFAVDNDVPLLWNGVHGAVDVRVCHLKVATFHPDKSVFIVRPNIEDERFPAVVSSLKELADGEMVEHTVISVVEGFLFLRQRGLVRAGHAPVLIGQHRCSTRKVNYRWAIGIRLKPQRVKTHGLSVVQEEGSRQRGGHPEQDFDGLRRLKRTDDARQDTEHTRFRAGGDGLGWRSFGKQVAILRSVVEIEERDLSLKSED